MEAVERTKLGFLVVVNENNEAVGVLTDGDIRRALLENFNNLTKVSEVMNPDFVFVFENTHNHEILKLMDGAIKFIPVLDEQRKLKDLHTPDTLSPRMDDTPIVKVSGANED